MNNREVDKQRNDIEKMRDRLHEEIFNKNNGKLGEKQVIKISQELDELITNYYRSIK